MGGVQDGWYMPACMTEFILSIAVENIKYCKQLFSIKIDEKKTKCSFSNLSKSKNYNVSKKIKDLQISAL